MLLDDIEITLSKLIDSPRSRSKKDENLSLEQLQERINKDQGENELTINLRNILNNLKNKCKAILMRRHKLLAHFDLTTAMQSSFNSLPDIPRQMIEEALKLTREYMNTIEIYYEGSEQRYEDFIMSTTDGEALISILKYGLRYKELNKDKDFFLKERNEGQWKDA